MVQDTPSNPLSNQQGADNSQNLQTGADFNRTAGQARPFT
jgi:hypothetical protein